MAVHVAAAEAVERQTKDLRHSLEDRTTALARLVIRTSHLYA